MLVTFRSTATDSITLFSEVAEALLKLMGASGKIPGALNPEDVPAALVRLEGAIERLRQQQHTPAAAPPAENEDWSAEDADEAERQPPVDLPTRAVPVISMLKRAAAAKAEVMWQAAS
jgi:hypothetical protein